MRSIGVALLILMFSTHTHAQQFQLPPESIGTEAALEVAMPNLAKQVLTTYTDSDRNTYLSKLFQLQLVAQDYANAVATLEALHQLHSSDKSASALLDIVPYEIYARAKLDELTNKLSFYVAYNQAFQSIVSGLDNLTAAKLNDTIGSPQEPYGPRLEDMQSDLEEAIARQKNSDNIALNDALDLLTKYEKMRSFADYHLLTDALIADDDRRRYIVEDNILIPTPDGAQIATMIMRPRTAARLSTLLGFTIYANPVWSQEEARITAAHGYAAVVSYTRGKGASPQTPIPLEHDGADADAVINWISKQAWSDGKVGMYGGSYNGFTQWAAAKHLPAALKAIMPSVTMAPGIDWPREGNVHMNFVYSWLPYTMSNKSLDQQNYDDRDRWTRLNKTWYTSGRAYRELDQIDGTINSSFQRWMDHPDYDAYWQSMIPYHQDFAKINIPVLTTTGYYDGGQIGALYYFNEHYKYNAQANHYLVIGPYNHIGAQRSAWDVLMGYRIDPIAHIDISWDLRYAWFDHVLRGAPMPALLTDKVNYEVMGANQWKHAKSISAMSNAKMRLYLTAMKSGDAYHLGAKAQKDKSFITQNIDFSDRSNVDESGGGGIIDTTVDKRNALVFVSDPLTQVTEVSGFFSGLLDFTTNKKDFDFNITLYEQQPDGKFFQLSWYMMRASYVNDLSHRRLLQPDLRHKLKFTNGRTTSKRFEAGSRVVAVLSINKQPTVQINYGSGKNVNDETIQDAGSPLQIKWFPDSYLDIPIEQ